MLYSGLFSPSLWESIGIALLLTHITILSITIYFHRGAAHRSINFHPKLAWFFRFWVWANTGINTTDWCAVHRKHHAKCETEQDPHSPLHKGLLTVLFKGAFLYRQEANNADTIARYAKDAPKDRTEAFFRKYSFGGILGFLALDLLLFGAIPGFFIWVAQVLWIPFWAAGVINGVGHYFGYRNHVCPDNSKNLTPIAFIVGGEELHNNHHAYPTSAKLSYKPWEFDWGWGVIRVLQLLKLAAPLKVMPQITLDSKPSISIQSLQALIAVRFETVRVLRKKLTPWIKQQLKERNVHTISYKEFVDWFFSPQSIEKQTSKEKTFLQVLKDNPLLEQANQMFHELKSLWEKSTASTQENLEMFKKWCHQAESSKIFAFASLSEQIKYYRLKVQ